MSIKKQIERLEKLANKQNDFSSQIMDNQFFTWLRIDRADRDPNFDRDLSIVKRRIAGENYPSIGKSYGISGNRCGQIFKKWQRIFRYRYQRALLDTP